MPNTITIKRATVITVPSAKGGMRIKQDHPNSVEYNTLYLFGNNLAKANRFAKPGGSILDLVVEPMQGSKGRYLRCVSAGFFTQPRAAASSESEVEETEEAVAA